MSGSRPINGRPGSSHQGGITSNGGNEVNEHTSLLSAPDSSSYNHGNSPMSEATDDDELEDTIEPNEFDKLLCRSESFSIGLSAGPESQETAMLRGPRRYSGLNPRSRAPSTVRRRKSFASTTGSTHTEAIDEEAIDAESNEPKSPFLGGVSSAQFWLIFGGVLAGNFVSCFDSTIMVSSHPVITSYFQSSNSASWLSTAFLLTSTAFQPLFGRLSDTIGRKGPYMFTMAVFLFATLWCALAQSMTSFIIARAVCGLGAGGMMTMGSIITSDLVPIEIRGAYQSYINIIYGIGSSLGAALGGAIADSLGWRWEFGIQLPALALCLIISHFTVPRKLGLAQGVERKTTMEAMKVFDFKGSILLTTSITFLILGLNLGGNVLPWNHPFIISSLIIFLLCFPLFLYVETTAHHPIMPLALIRQNPRAGLILSNSIGCIITQTVLFNIPLYFQAVLLQSATSSGFKLIIPTLAASSIGTMTGFLITYTKRLKWILNLGVFILAIGTSLLCIMKKGMSDGIYMIFLIIVFIGQGFMFPGTFMSVLAVSEQAEQAVVTSTLILWRSMGMVLGVAVSSLVVQNALLFYLERDVVGDQKQKVIEEVRKSVRAIIDLDPYYQEQVINSYALSLRATFIMAAILSFICIFITLPLRLPRLGERK